MNTGSFAVALLVLATTMAGCAKQEFVTRQDPPKAVASVVSAGMAEAASIDQIVPTPAPTRASVTTTDAKAPKLVRTTQLTATTRFVETTYINNCRKEVITVLEVLVEGIWTGTSLDRDEITTQGCATFQDVVKSGPGVLLALSAL
jgi:hypothetical protein